MAHISCIAEQDGFRRRLQIFTIANFVVTHGRKTWRSLRSAGALLLMVWLSNAFANDDKFAINVWQTEDGLPSDTITSLAQTPDGFLWTGTPAGLARFDGVRFVTIREPKELEGQRIERLFTDRAGTLWISTREGALLRRMDNAFAPFGPNSGWPNLAVQSFAQEHDGTVLLATIHGGLFRQFNERFERLLPDAPDKRNSTEMACDQWGDQTVWVRRASSVGYLRGTNWVEITREGGVPIRVGALAPRRNGGVWIFSGPRTLDVLREGKWPIQSQPYPPFMDPHRLLDDAGGHLWIGTTRQGLIRTATNDSGTRYFSGTGFPTEQINSLLEDRDGNVWVGGSGSGLVRLSRRSFFALGPEAGFPTTAPLCLTEDSVGILVCYAEVGLRRIVAGNLSGPLEFSGRALGRSAGWAVLAGRDGQNWFAGYGVGLFGMRDGTSKLWAAREGLPSNDIQALADDNEGALWIGGVKGLVRFDGKEFVNVSERDAFPRGEVDAVITDREGSVWAGTLGSGVVRWRSGTAEVFSVAQGLSSDRVHSLMADHDGSLWIGTSQGLGWLRNGKVISFDERTGLANAYIVGIVDDGGGFLWLATRRGALRVSRAELSAVADGKLERLNVRTFGREDGLPAARMSDGQFSALRAKDGRLWFATLKGLAVIDPRSVRPEPHASQPVIEEMVIDGIEQRRAMEEQLQVPAGSRRVEFHYTAANLTAPRRVQFKRRVEGLDNEWQDVGPERTVAFHGLQPGNYRLRVRAGTSDGVWSADEATLAFAVAPWFWETSWFRGGAALAVALAFGFLFRWRTQALEKRRSAQQEFSRQLMEQQEAERKRIAAELHDSLGQSLSIIQNRAVLATQESDAARSSGHVAGISSAAAEALNNVREICQGLRPVELDRLGLSKTLQAITERIAESSGLKIVSEIDPIDSLLTTENWIHVLRFVQEALNNAVKHARATEITVTLREDDDCLRLVIADNGIGFDHQSAGRGRSLGLHTMEERSRILGAELRIDSSPGHGSTVRLNVPKR